MKVERLQRSHMRLSCDTNGHQEGKTLALPVAAPVLEEYNYIDLRKQTRRRRIDHLVLSQLPVLGQSRSESSRKAKWQQSLDRYILAKEQLQSRRAQQQSSEFEFLRLNKINQYRKIKLVEANSLPLSIISSTDLHETYSFDLDPELSKGRRVSTEKATIHQQQSHAVPQQQRIMNSILENYFKKKYSQPASRKIYPKSEKYASALVKKQKRKIKF